MDKRIPHGLFTTIKAWIKGHKKIQIKTQSTTPMCMTHRHEFDESDLKKPETPNPRLNTCVDRFQIYFDMYDNFKWTRLISGSEPK